MSDTGDSQAGGGQPTLGEEDLMPWERAKLEDAPSARENLEALEDLIAQEEPDEFGYDEDEKTPQPPRRKPKKPAPSEEEVDDDDDEVDDEETEDQDVDEEEASDDLTEEELEELDLPMDAIVEVPVAGEQVQVTLEEAIQGYQRQADYTRKTQAVAEDRKAYSDGLRETLQVREALGQQLQLLEAALAEDGTPPDHWATLRVENPEQFANEYAAFEQRNAKLNEVRQAIAKQREAGAAELKAAHEARLVDERNRLTEAIPEWQDERVFDEALDAIQTFIVDSYGATDAELEQISDHRFILMARDAMLYRQAKSKGKETLEKSRKKGGARILKPGASRAAVERAERGKGGKRMSSKKVKAYRQRRERLARTGSVKDAAAALLELEDE